MFLVFPCGSQKSRCTVALGLKKFLSSNGWIRVDKKQSQICSTDVDTQQHEASERVSELESKNRQTFIETFLLILNIQYMHVFI